jgi:hypothetical protein
MKEADCSDRARLSLPTGTVSAPSCSACLPCPKRGTLSYERRPNLYREKWYSIGPSNGCLKILPRFVHDGCTSRRARGTLSRTLATINTATLGETTSISSSSTPSLSTVRSSTSTDRPDSSSSRTWSTHFGSSSPGPPKTSRFVSFFQDQPLNLAKKSLIQLEGELEDRHSTQPDVLLYKALNVLGLNPTLEHVDHEPINPVSDTYPRVTPTVEADFPARVRDEAKKVSDHTYFIDETD